MTTLTIRIPEDKHERLKLLAHSRRMSVNFEMEVQADGTILLRPMRVIPEADAWIYTPETRERLARADTWMAANPPRETDLEALAGRLGTEE